MQHIGTPEEREVRTAIRCNPEEFIVRSIVIDNAEMLQQPIPAVALEGAGPWLWLNAIVRKELRVTLQTRSEETKLIAMRVAGQTREKEIESKQAGPYQGNSSMFQTLVWVPTKSVRLIAIEFPREVQ